MVGVGPDLGGYCGVGGCGELGLEPKLGGPPSGWAWAP